MRSDWSEDITEVGVEPELRDGEAQMSKGDAEEG
jgi:hypothetical protein